MSRSLTNHYASLRFSNPAAVGVHLGRTEIHATRVARSAAGVPEQSSTKTSLGAPLFKGAPSPDHEFELTRALTTVCSPWGREFVRLNVSLPDAMGWLATYAFEQLPRSSTLRQTLARWRLATDLRMNEDRIECDCQAIGQEKGKHLLLAQALDKAWLDVVHRALKTCGLVPWALNQSVYFRFNRLRDVLGERAQEQALLFVDADSWSLALCDSSARIRSFRSGWRDSPPGEGDALGLADEVERTILAYVASGDAAAVKQVHVCGSDPAVAAISEILTMRMTVQCHLLSLCGSNTPQGVESAASLSLAAALTG